MKLERPDLWLAACVKFAEAYENNTAQTMSCAFCETHKRIYPKLGSCRNDLCVWQYFTGHSCNYGEINAAELRKSGDPEWRTRRIGELRTEWIPALRKLVAESEKGE